MRSIYALVGCLALLTVVMSETACASTTHCYSDDAYNFAYELGERGEELAPYQDCSTTRILVKGYNQGLKDRCSFEVAAEAGKRRGLSGGRSLDPDEYAACVDPDMVEGLFSGAFFRARLKVCQGQDLLDQARLDGEEGRELSANASDRSFCRKAQLEELRANIEAEYLSGQAKYCVVERVEQVAEAAARKGEPAPSLAAFAACRELAALEEHAATHHKETAAALCRLDRHRKTAEQAGRHGKPSPEFENTICSEETWAKMSSVANKAYKKGLSKFCQTKTMEKAARALGADGEPPPALDDFAICGKAFQKKLARAVGAAHKKGLKKHCSAKEAEKIGRSFGADGRSAPDVEKAFGVCGKKALTKLQKVASEAHQKSLRQFCKGSDIVALAKARAAKGLTAMDVDVTHAACPAKKRKKLKASYAKAYRSGLKKFCTDDLLSRTAKRLSDAPLPEQLPREVGVCAVDGLPYRKKLATFHERFRDQYVEANCTYARGKRQGSSDAKRQNETDDEMPDFCDRMRVADYRGGYDKGWAAGKAEICSDEDGSYSDGLERGLADGSSRFSAPSLCPGQYGSRLASSFRAGFQEGTRRREREEDAARRDRERREAEERRARERAEAREREERDRSERERLAQEMAARSAPTVVVVQGRGEGGSNVAANGAKGARCSRDRHCVGDLLCINELCTPDFSQEVQEDCSTHLRDWHTCAERLDRLHFRPGPMFDACRTAFSGGALNQCMDWAMASRNYHADDVILACTALFDGDERYFCVETNIAMVGKARKPLIEACGQHFSFDDDRLECAKRTNTASEVVACSRGFGFSKDRHACLAIASKAQYSMEDTIAACVAGLGFDKERMSCVARTAKYDVDHTPAVRACMQRSWSNEKLACLGD